MKYLAVSFLRLIIALVVYIPLVLVFKLSSEWAIIGGCILFAGFISASLE